MPSRSAKQRMPAPLHWLLTRSARARTGPIGRRCALPNIQGLRDRASAQLDFSRLRQQTKDVQPCLLRDPTSRKNAHSPSCPRNQNKPRNAKSYGAFACPHPRSGHRPEITVESRGAGKGAKSGTMADDGVADSKVLPRPSELRHHLGSWRKWAAPLDHGKSTDDVVKDPSSLSDWGLCGGANTDGDVTISWSGGFG